MMTTTHPVRSSDYINSLLGAAELACVEAAQPLEPGFLASIRPCEVDPIEVEELLDTDTDIDEHGRMVTTYRAPRGPRLHAGADYHITATRQEAAQLLETHGGWLEGLWGPMADAPDHWVRVAAANVMLDSVADDAWLTD